jgi:uncharacterized membrane protein
MDNNFVGPLLVVVGFILIFAGMIASNISKSNELETIQNELETIQKEAIKHNYATYDENNEFQWIIPEEKKSDE